MDSKTEVLQFHNCVYRAGESDIIDVLHESDVVAGNRYRWRDARSPSDCTLVPDPDGPFLALVTHRGKNAPPRPEVLPVGTRVRRGPDWIWGDDDGGAGCLGTIIGRSCLGLGWCEVLWDDGVSQDATFGATVNGKLDYDLEVVSLPALGGVTVYDKALDALKRAQAAAGPPVELVGGVTLMEVPDPSDSVMQLVEPSDDAVPMFRIAFNNSREDRTAPGVGREPDMVPAAVLARRTPVRVVPTDLDDHWIPDADESMTGRMR